MMRGWRVKGGAEEGPPKKDRFGSDWCDDGGGGRGWGE